MSILTVPHATYHVEGTTLTDARALRAQVDADEESLPSRVGGAVSGGKRDCISDGSRPLIRILRERLFAVPITAITDCRLERG